MSKGKALPHCGWVGEISDFARNQCTVKTENHSYVGQARKTEEGHRVGTLPHLLKLQYPNTCRAVARRGPRLGAIVNLSVLGARDRFVSPFGVAEPLLTSHQSLLSLTSAPLPGMSSYRAGTPHISIGVYPSIPSGPLPRLVSDPFPLRSICTSGFPL